MHNETRNSTRFLDDLAHYAKDHRGGHWNGTFREFLEQVLPTNPPALARTSHQYIWDTLRWYPHERSGQNNGEAATQLFADELFGTDHSLATGGGLLQGGQRRLGGGTSVAAARSALRW